MLLVHRNIKNNFLILTLYPATLLNLYSNSLFVDCFEYYHTQLCSVLKRTIWFLPFSSVYLVISSKKFLFYFFALLFSLGLQGRHGTEMMTADVLVLLLMSREKSSYIWPLRMMFIVIVFIDWSICFTSLFGPPISSPSRLCRWL